MSAQLLASWRQEDLCRGHSDEGMRAWRKLEASKVGRGDPEGRPESGPVINLTRGPVGI